MTFENDSLGVQSGVLIRQNIELPAAVGSDVPYDTKK